MTLLQIPMTLLQKCYNNATAVLQTCRLQVTTCHYSHYNVYRFREKVTWFADARPQELHLRDLFY
jgi:hypothetical protein